MLKPHPRPWAVFRGSSDRVLRRFTYDWQARLYQDTRERATGTTHRVEFMPTQPTKRTK